MILRAKRTRRFCLFAVPLAWVLAIARVATAVEVGDKAPDFTLPSTTGGNVILRQFQGRKLVLLEFYVSDFRPT
ncbi:MAG: hypothetical protein A2038_14410 [Deltaproteobacteria bacterium GWA2_57_13]|nr:MAG: hypothetical protein A2038_14410 [Deltaproteobacteria bacterium GWA2_57_13]OGQ81834.1 MAG: hypothetical protein A3G40_13430 [Deltaproteobacteria bacterium RIFCSPLOWO2_12_FULL_57_22]